jgi:tetratricopeptide (TPR) repeat protein
MMTDYIPEFFYTSEDTVKFRSVITHIETIGNYLYSDSTTDDRIAEYYSAAGVGHKEISNYETALSYYFKAVAIRENNARTGKLGLVYNNIAVVYNHKTKYRLSLEYYFKSLEVAEKHNASTIDLAIIYNNLAITYMKCTAYDEAVEWNTKCLELLANNSITDKPINADALTVKSTLLYLVKQFEEALELDFEALKVLQKAYPDEFEEHSDVASVYNHIAREYFSLVNYETALDYYLKAHKIYESIYGENDTDTAETCGSIAITYSKLKEFNHALDWCLKALRAQEAVFGKEHPEVILRYSFVADLYEELGVFDKVIVYMLKALDFLSEQKNDTPVIETMKSVYTRIAVCYEKLDLPDKAVDYREKAVGMERCDERKQDD